MGDQLIKSILHIHIPGLREREREWHNYKTSCVLTIDLAWVNRPFYVCFLRILLNYKPNNIPNLTKYSYFILFVCIRTIWIAYMNTTSTICIKLERLLFFLIIVIVHTIIIGGNRTPINHTYEFMMYPSYQNMMVNTLHIILD